MAFGYDNVSGSGYDVPVAHTFENGEITLTARDLGAAVKDRVIGDYNIKITFKDAATTTDTVRLTLTSSILAFLKDTTLVLLPVLSLLALLSLYLTMPVVVHSAPLGKMMTLMELMLQIVLEWQ